VGITKPDTVSDVLGALLTYKYLPVYITIDNIMMEVGGSASTRDREADAITRNSMLMVNVRT
jgi:hypothetical protein